MKVNFWSLENYATDDIPANLDMCMIVQIYDPIKLEKAYGIREIYMQ